MANYADFKLADDAWYEKSQYEDAQYYFECAKVGTAHLIPQLAPRGAAAASKVASSMGISYCTIPS